MGLENGKWRVKKGDCLWNIAKSVYKNAYKWKEIASANGISQKTALIYPNQLLTLPGITSGTSSGGSSTPAPYVPPPKPNIVWFTLTAGTDREMQAIWEMSENHFQIRWEQWDSNGHLWLINEQNVEKTAENNDRTTTSIQTLDSREGWNICRFSVRAEYKDANGNHTGYSDWSYQEYDFRNNPPGIPSEPSISIDNGNVLTVELSNIDEKINANQIEIAVYKDNTIKYTTGVVAINSETRYAKYTTNVDTGAVYKVRCRAIRNGIYGGWTSFTSNEQSLPIAPSEITVLRPQIISEQMSKEYGVYAEWTNVNTAKTYEIQWAKNIEYFDTDQVSSKTTEEGHGPNALLTGIELGHEYFFRVRSTNDKGNSISWSPIKSLIMGTKPSAPTTWSNTSSGVIGEDINLYWSHNSSDGSIETYARLHITVTDSEYPDKEPMEYTKVIENTKPDEDKDKTSVYTINTTDTEWANVKAGFIVKWKVQTAGIASEYSEWSVEREINVYAKPELTIDIKNQNGESVSEINEFPIYVNVLAKPYTQIPLSYYIEVVSNNAYTTMDDTGQRKTINVGDKIYQKYYDPEQNAWEFMLVLDPSNIDLENNVNYTINCTVAMNSGLTANISQSFDVYFNDLFYDVYADVIINNETLEASIHPYCNEYYIDDNNETQSKLVEKCTLSVYRREYNGTFTEIATNIDNLSNTYITDPHPALDYARYRIVAKTNDTGSISYSDIEPIKVSEPSIVIQWGEEWKSFDVNDDYDGTVEPAWSGSMIKLPYNVDTNESNSLDTTLIEYAGRQHPVSYYGTQVGEKASLNSEIPITDKETIYALRRLKVWSDDVYVREPSGIGYWAKVEISMSSTHGEVTMPIGIEVTRVEGGI